MGWQQCILNLQLILPRLEPIKSRRGIRDGFELEFRLQRGSFYPTPPNQKGDGYPRA